MSRRASARELHGITDEELAAVPTLPEIWPTLQEVLCNRVTLVAYNVDFDRARQAQSACRYHLEAFPQEWSARWRPTPPFVAAGQTITAAPPGSLWLCWSACVEWRRWYEREYASSAEGEQDIDSYEA